MRVVPETTVSLGSRDNFAVPAAFANNRIGIIVRAHCYKYTGVVRALILKGRQALYELRVVGRIVAFSPL